MKITANHSAREETQAQVHVLCADLFDFCEVILRVAVEHEASDRSQREVSVRHDLGDLMHIRTQGHMHRGTVSINNHAARFLTLMLSRKMAGGVGGGGGATV
jgi:hypothetical protein